LFATSVDIDQRNFAKHINLMNFCRTT